MIPEGKHAFTSWLLPLAEAVIPRRGLPGWCGRWGFALCAHETDYGRDIPGGSHEAIDGPGPKGLTTYNLSGDHWKKGRELGYVEDDQGQGVRKQRYTRFSSASACLDNLARLIGENGYRGYAEAREQHFLLTLTLEELLGADSAWIRPQITAARASWILEFSQHYCPKFSGHGPSILRIFEEMGDGLEPLDRRKE